MAQRPLQGLLRQLAKDRVIPRTYFDSVRSLPECCHALPQAGLGHMLVPSGRSLRTNVYHQPEQQSCVTANVRQSSAAAAQPLAVKDTLDAYYLITRIQHLNRPGQEVYHGIRLLSTEHPLDLLAEDKDSYRAFAREEVLPAELVFSSWRVLGLALTGAELEAARARFNASASSRAQTEKGGRDASGWSYGPGDRKAAKVERILAFRAARRLAAQKAKKSSSSSSLQNDDPV